LRKRWGYLPAYLVGSSNQAGVARHEDDRNTDTNRLDESSGHALRRGSFRVT